MKGWLQKILTPPTRSSARPAPMVKTGDSRLPTQPVKSAPPVAAGLPNATVIYGIGASFLFVASLFLLVGGRWFASLVVFALGLCLVGFALHLLKHQD